MPIKKIFKDTDELIRRLALDILHLMRTKKMVPRQDLLALGWTSNQLVVYQGRATKKAKHWHIKSMAYEVGSEGTFNDAA